MNKKYEIGYGKPPAEHQFKAGESGNKKGRPKGSKNLNTIIIETSNQKITLQEKNKKTKVTKAEGLVQQLFHKGLKGNVKANTAALDLIKEADIKQEEKNKVIESLNTDNLAIIEMAISDLIGLKNNEEVEDHGFTEQDQDDAH